MQVPDGGGLPLQQPSARCQVKGKCVDDADRDPDRECTSPHIARAS